MVDAVEQMDAGQVESDWCCITKGFCTIPEALRRNYQVQSVSKRETERGDGKRLLPEYSIRPRQEQTAEATPRTVGRSRKALSKSGAAALS
jgi:hypothetical protein